MSIRNQREPGPYRTWDGCRPGAWGSPTGCISHEGLDLDLTTGRCPWGDFKFLGVDIVAVHETGATMNGVVVRVVHGRSLVDFGARRLARFDRWTGAGRVKSSKGWRIEPADREKIEEAMHGPRPARIVLTILGEEGPATSEVLMGRTKLSKTTITGALAQLSGQGKVAKAGWTFNLYGRRVQVWRCA